MRRGRGRSGGYTVVETMIFLAVTGMLFVSAMVFVSGQQQKTQFSQGVREFASDLQMIANNVSTGYAAFPFESGHCWIDATGMNITVGASGIENCIFIGRALQFMQGPSGDVDTYKTYSVVGKQHDTSGQEVRNLAAALPLALSPGAAFNTGGTEYGATRKRLSGGLTVAWVRYGTSEASLSAGQQTTGFGFYTNFARYSGTQISSNSTQVAMLPVVTSPSPSFTDSGQQFVDRLDGFLRTPAQTNAAAANTVVSVCLNSDSTRQHAIITLGGDANGNLQVKTTILESTCP